MRQINPSFKLIGLIVVTFVIALVHNPILSLAVFAVSFVLMLMYAESRTGVLIPLLIILILAVGMFFTGYRFTSPDTQMTVVNLSNQYLADSRVWNGLIFASRVLVYAGIGLLFAFTTDRVKMVLSFERQLHMPQIFAYGLLAAFGLFPQMRLEYKRTRLAFKARGIRVYPFSPALLTTLMVKSVRWSEELSIAMESKGFSGHEPRTHYEVLKPGVRDWIFILATCAAFPAFAFIVFS